MARSTNPYRPGFNQAPAVLAGRDQVLGDAWEALETAALDGRTPRPLVLVGPRGVGKTVTLGEIAAVAAERYSWPAVHVEAAPGVDLVEDLSRRLAVVADLLAGRTARPAGAARDRQRSRVTGGKVGAQAFGVGGEVEVSRQVRDVDGPSLDEQLAATMARAVEREAGVVVTLDELHAADAGQAGRVAAVLQQAVPEGWPLVVCAAALPSIRSLRGKAGLPTYLERAEWHDLGPLDDDDAAQALLEPAAAEERPIDADAAVVLLEVAGGYPYAVQVAGHFAWRASHGADRITLAHAEAALPRIRADLDQLFTSRWDDASGKEQEYLAAMAELALDGPVISAEVAARLGRGTRQVSYLRERLIRKGTIYVAADRSLCFITPGMAAWVRERGRGR